MLWLVGITLGLLFAGAFQEGQGHLVPGLAQGTAALGSMLYDLPSLLKCTFETT